ncbi:unnamed protein product [Rotaria socialis]|uniref:Uncharacterized protein n=6 Tax=Rotaria socialis TaxID=392032 RepID=A0A820DS62_9BILA|nr:unnamed protein product [Rotaria socialis]CAF3188381.1 unnamed protein product [Rotaria socialis]CAF3642539.1 unnamed protein product [Rotaria socialis]CAF3669947.1 unnamed protein product [Rotaria socialis]CAF4145396.1 unnamed protein product [Rotaria socialis]
MSSKVQPQEQTGKLSDASHETQSKKRESCRLDWAESSWTRWINVALWWWIKPLILLGNRRTLVDEDLSDISVKDKCVALLNKANCDSSKWPGTWNLIRRTFLKDFFETMWFMLAFAGTRIAQPLLLREIIIYISDTSGLPAYRGYLFAIGLTICSIIQAIVHQQAFFRNQRVGMRMRNTLSCAIYKHLLTINTASLYKTTAAQTINLVANDAGKFEEMTASFHYIWVAPLEAFTMFGLIWWIIGLPTLFGYAALALLLPLQFVCSRLFSQYRKVTMACTDTRVQTINELIHGCQIIKMYNWEKAMEQLVRDTRRAELQSIFRSSRLRALNFSIFFSSLPLISLATFGGSWLMGKQLIAANIFTALSFFGMLRMSVALMLPGIIEKLSEARVAARRIDQFMEFEILLNRREQEANEKGDHAIIMEDASFSWKDTPSLFSLRLKIKHNTLVGIKGSTGAGKSSLLAAILGEINLVSGKLQQCVRSISYAPQSSWIFADTIRNNILLGKPMDEERYQNVIKACCLDVDLQNFGEVGDLMMIGDKGVNLSGGQKARVSLARALYVDAELYLLDDPIAAVDPKVAKKIFDQCIGPRSLLSQKTRILVTHQIHFLAEADQTILLANGRIDEFHTEQPAADEQSNDTTESDSPDENNEDENENDFKLITATKDMNSIVKNEASTEGSVQWKVWLQLFTAPPLRWLGFFLLIILLLVTEALYDFTNRWLALWSAKSEANESSSSDAYVYLGLTLGTFLASLLRAGFHMYIMLRGSTFFHNQMLNGILYTSLRFFESNPSGRILNRASKDQQILDELLPVTVIDTIQNLLMILGTVVIIGIINPWVLLIFIPLVPLFWWLHRFYMRSSLQLKRLESVTRSPIYSLFSSSLEGLTSIRAFGVQHDFINMFMEKVDSNFRAYFVLIAASRWFGLQLTFMTTLLTCLTAILAVALRHQIDPSAAALSLTYSITISTLFQWAVRQSAEAENLMTSAERIHEYGQLVPESHRNNRKTELLVQPPHDWPSRGIIEFKDYTFRYRPELDPVLKNLNLHIKSKEKIGVIGRTGAGKSSLLQALFRLVDQSSITGSIYIDGIDIGCLSLDQLRSHLSVIPQVPILFCGTLRYNLDPFSQYSDEECLKALESVQLKHLVINNPNGLTQLVAESGSNLSAGERQLICVARAILKRSHILLIDEATAHVDHATDSMIQSVIADKFRDRTILTIAHRLNTIANSDRILMLEQGEIAYFDVPSGLNLT